MKSQRKSVAIVGLPSSVFVPWTAELFEKNGVKATVVSQYSDHYPGLSRFGKLGRLSNRFLSLRRDIAEAPKSDTAIVLSLTPDIVWMVPYLKWRFRRVVGQTYGSDILRRDKRKDWLYQRALRMFDVIAAQNENILAEINISFTMPSKQVQRLTRFGLPVLSKLDEQFEKETQKAEIKKQLGLDSNAFIVALGYSPAPGQRQSDLISYFSENIEDHPGVQFILPAQYGEDMHKNLVQKLCDDANEKLSATRFFCLRDFFHLEQVARLRRATDILINHSVTDAFSGSVQEVLYSGNYVLAGDHLPYSTLPGHGSTLFLYRDLQDCSEKVKMIHNNVSAGRLVASRDIEDIRAEIRNLSGESEVAKDWLSVIDGTVS